MPPGAVYVGRPTKWGNPYWIERVDAWTYNVRTEDTFAGTFDNLESARYWAMMTYRAWWSQRSVTNEEIHAELAGRDLVCWCPLDQPCHADVLLEIANSPEAAGVPS